jgi:hypothetical protein
LKTYVYKNISRRDLLKLGFYSAVGINFINLSMLSGCVTVGLEAYKEPTPVHYPRLSGKKIQSPEHYGLEGCYVGGYRLSQKEYYRWTKKPPSIVYTDNVYGIKNVHSVHRKIMGIDGEQKLEETTIPFVSYDVEGWIRLRGLDGIINGSWDNVIKTHAENARNIGEKYGGFFIRTLREMNIKDVWPPWGSQPKKFKKTYTHIWDIFDSEGANEYATWVFSPYTLSSRGSDSWERYYPGDKYVDWVGINGYNFAGQRTQWTVFPYQSFFSLFCLDYNTMRKNHPDKPIMIAGTGMDELKSKPKWVTDAFNTLKNDFPGIKAFLVWNEYWSHINMVNFDSRIYSSDVSLQAFVKGVSDPYFIGAVPYL